MSRLCVGGALVVFLVSCGGSAFQSGGETGGGPSSGGTGGEGGTGTSGGTPSSGGTSGQGGAGSGGVNASGSSNGGNASKGGNAGSAGKGGNAGKGGSAGSAGKGGTSGGGGGGKGGSAGASGAGSGGSAGGCGSGCGQARECCGSQCVNPANDPKNCGACGVECDATKYCADGSCVTPPCEMNCGAGTLCCGSACCGAGQLCCDPQGPLSTGPVCTAPNEQGTCPMGCAPLCICASPDTPIATPGGDRAIASLKAGDLVYSLDRGRLVTVPIVRTIRTPTHNHRVVRVVLSGQRVLEISPRHPTADGRTFGDLKSGDRLDGVDIAHASTIPYAHDATYDVLPASDSGTYFAAGVLVGSTLAPSAPHITEVSTPECLRDW